jgi:hypothetical protein
MEENMALEWQVIAIGCGALVMAFITSLRSKTGAVLEQLDSHALGFKKRSARDGTVAS